MTDLTKENFQLSAAKSYRKRLCFTTQSFRYDIAHLDINNDLRKYFDDPSNQMLRMVLNKLITACNLFGPDACELILFKIQHNIKYHILVSHLFNALGIMKDFTPDKELQEKINAALQ